MKANQRRQEILDRLKQASQPISASQLAAQFEVSRQVIVGDVALLREGWFAATGQRIQKTSSYSSLTREGWYWMWRLSIQFMAC